MTEVSKAQSSVTQVTPKEQKGEEVMTIEQLKSRSLENICTKGNVFVAANRATRLPANVKNDEVANV